MGGGSKSIESKVAYEGIELKSVFSRSTKMLEFSRVETI
jgi:hypothetical protein